MLEKRLKQNLDYIKTKLGFGISFDIQVRQFVVGGKNAAIIFVDGFIKDISTSRILYSLMNLKRDEILPGVIQKIFNKIIDYFEIEEETEIEKVIDQILSGQLALLIDGETKALIIDVREYPARAPEEPDIERVSRGSRDGFIETLVHNTTLVRRRVRDPGLRVEIQSVGARSKTDVAIVYINDIADPKIVSTIRKRIEEISIDGIPMAEKTVEEFIVDRKTWLNPFPTVRYTERPDVAAVHLFEGHILVMVDTSPSVMILPVTLFHHLEHAEEYRNDIGVGIYFRFIRLTGIMLSLLLPPIWLALALNPHMLPEALDFIGPKEMTPIPLFLQFVFAELGIDLIRMASIHTPSPLATALGLIGAILLGEFAVQVGIFVPETILYVALAAIGTFSTPSLEFAHAVRMSRIVLLILSGVVGLAGLLAGFIALLVLLMYLKSFEVPYLWPLIPLNIRALVAAIIRLPIPLRMTRPEILHPSDPDMRPNKG